METIEATVPFIHPPRWALLERSLFDLLDRAATPLLERYVRADGTIMWPTQADFASIDGLDDAYESFHNWPLYYALGGARLYREASQREYDAITAQFARYGTGHGHPMVVKEYEQGYDWMHQGEGYELFYMLGLADPEHPANRQRARRYAGLFMGEDPEAPNWDSERRLLRSPHVGSMGPAWRNFDKYYTHYRYESWKPWPLPYLDLAGIASVEDLKDPANERRMGEAIVRCMARGDVVANLASTTMATHAYLLTGDEQCRRWVREYAEAWIERAARNGGVVPDNVGLSGQVGEYLQGKWYGGYYGWSWPHGWHTIGDAVLAAAENLALLFQDPGWIDFGRRQVLALVERGRVQEGTLQVPHFHTDRGWEGFAPLHARYLAHVWTVSQAAGDLELVRRTRDHLSRDWARVIPQFSKHGGNHEAAWLSYLMGEYPEYPIDILEHNHAQVYQRLAFMRDDRQDPATYGDRYLQVRNPVTVEGLLQLLTGGPMFLYNGGLQLGRLWYFDAVARRPGLPPDTAALVSGLEDRQTRLTLVNLSPDTCREVVVQGGTFGEHRFTDAAFTARGPQGQPSPHWTDHQYREHVDAAVARRQVHVGAACLAVRLPPGTWIELELGTQRFAAAPRYGLPW